MILTRKQYEDAILWDQATGVTRGQWRKNWPTLHGLSKDSPKYKQARMELNRLENMEFKAEWDALREFLKP